MGILSAEADEMLDYVVEMRDNTNTKRRVYRDATNERRTPYVQCVPGAAISPSCICPNSRSMQGIVAHSPPDHVLTRKHIIAETCPVYTSACLLLERLFYLAHLAWSRWRTHAVRTHLGACPSPRALSSRNAARCRDSRLVSRHAPPHRRH